MVRFSVTTASEVLPFYSYVYILDNYGIILKVEIKNSVVDGYGGFEHFISLGLLVILHHS